MRPGPALRHRRKDDYQPERNFPANAALAIDFAKVIASFNSRAPVGGNNYVGKISWESPILAPPPGLAGIGSRISQQNYRNLFQPGRHRQVLYAYLYWRTDEFRL